MRKSWRGLIIWLILFCLGLVLIAFLSPFEEEALMIRVILNYSNLMVAGFMAYIMISGNVWMINGVTFEEAVAAEPERRYYFARAHLTRFADAGLIYLVLSVLFTLFHLPWLADMAGYLFLTCAAAFSTIRIHL